MAKKPPKDEVMRFDLAHYSMQFSDTPEQQAQDVRKMFQQNYHGITGTEAGQLPMQRALRALAFEFRYALHIYKSNFVAINKDLISRGEVHKFGETFVDNDETVGRGHDLNVVGMTVETDGIGTWSLMGSHYSTNGTPAAVDPARRVNIEANKKLARGIGNLAKELGAGADLVFYGGDQNIVDRDADTFFGEDLTSVWDELGKYENTGHGNIDVIASYDKDKRVEAKYIRALTDKEQFMHTDHFPVEAGFNVRLLRDKNR